MKAEKTVKRLKALLRMLKNIPAKNVNGNNYITKFSEENPHKNVMCLGGWLAYHGYLTKSKIWIQIDGFGTATISVGENNLFDAVFMDHFGITLEESDSLFYNSSLPSNVLLHKQHLLNAINDILVTYESEVLHG